MTKYIHPMGVLIEKVSTSGRNKTTGYNFYLFIVISLLLLLLLLLLYIFGLRISFAWLTYNGPKHYNSSIERHFTQQEVQ